MNMTNTRDTVTRNSTATPNVGHEHHGQGGHKGWRHSLLMIACCIPMIIIAVALVATGVASASFLIFAVVCVGMMALMMGGMNHGGGHK